MLVRERLHYIVFYATTGHLADSWPSTCLSVSLPFSAALENTGVLNNSIFLHPNSRLFGIIRQDNIGTSSLETCQGL